MQMNRRVILARIGKTRLFLCQSIGTTNTDSYRTPRADLHITKALPKGGCFHICFTGGLSPFLETSATHVDDVGFLSTPYNFNASLYHLTVGKDAGVGGL